MGERMLPVSLINRLLRRRGLGCRPDPADARDRPLGALLGALAVSPPPASASVRSALVAPKDQGWTSSCTGQAWVQAIRTTLLHRGAECPDLSALFSYWLGRAEWGGERRDEGSHLRTAAKAMVRFGCATESAWPMVSARVNKQPPFGAFRSGHDLRGLRGYYRVAAGDVDGVRRAIAAGYAVVGGWRIDQAFVDATGPAVLDVPTGSIVGGHAWVLENYAADSTFGILNSWGPTWKMNGRARMTAAFVARGSDIWACAA